MENRPFRPPTCTHCGSPLIQSLFRREPFCEKCEGSTIQPTLPFEEPLEIGGKTKAEADLVSEPPKETESSGTGDPEPIGITQEPGPIESISSWTDPDRPHWTVRAAFGVWFFSVAAIFAFQFMFQMLAVLVWMVNRQTAGVPPVSNDPGEELVRWSMSPTAIFIGVMAIIFAHGATLAAAWFVVTGKGSDPFLKSLGWHWAGLSRVSRVFMVIAVVIGMIVVLRVLTLVLPDSDTTPFEQMLRSSRAVRVLVVILAVGTAPVVEEVVYRGVLYGALRRRWGMAAAIVIVSLLFPLVHVPQYWGAWASIAGLTVLSASLTAIRAATGSILPCVVIHLVFNALQSLEILRAGWD